MWQYALWGLVGAAANVGIVFLEASQRVKGPPWRYPYGPGGGMYAVSVLIHLGIAAAAVAALSTTTVIANGLVAFGAGAAAPVIVKKAAMHAESLVPWGGTPQPPQDGG